MSDLEYLKSLGIEPVRAERIMSCVDACTGIVDPKAAIKMAKAALEYAMQRATDDGLGEIATECGKALRALGG